MVREGFGGFADAFGDIFGEIFGQQGRGGRGNGVFRGADLRYNLELSLEEAARGTEAKIRIPTMEQCETCHGTGAKPGTQAEARARRCHGRGEVRVSQGFFSIQQTCPTCHGTGKVVTDPCATCHGAGRMREAQDAVGQDSAGRRPGRPHPPCRAKARRASTAGRTAISTSSSTSSRMRSSSAKAPTCIARCRSASPPPRSAARSRFPTLDGQAKIKIPAETQTGQVFRLRNKGIRPVRGSVTGDLYCHVAIETPIKLTSRQKEMLREFEAINQEDPAAHTPRAKGFFDRVKEFFGA